MKSVLMAAVAALSLTGAAAAGMPAKPTIEKHQANGDVVQASYKPGSKSKRCPPNVWAPFCK